MDQITWLGYDGLPLVEALERQQGRAATVHIQYFESRVELLEKREDMAVWRQTSTGRQFQAPVEWTYHDGDGRLHYSDYADTLLKVEPGDRLPVILRTSAGYYCKKDGLIGWYQGEARPVEQRLELWPGIPGPGAFEPGNPDLGTFEPVFLSSTASGAKECHRRERELAVYGLLGKLDIEYQRVDHVQGSTMEVCRAVEEALEGALICKNLFLCNRQRTKFYLLMMPGDKVFKTRELSAQIGSSRLSFGEAVYMEKYLHTSPGSVSVMGLMHDTGQQVQLLMDRDILRGSISDAILV